MNRHMHFFTVPLVLTLVLGCGVHPSTVQSNNEGVERFKSEDFYGSYQQFIQSLVNEPFHPLIHLNLGLSFQANEEKAKAGQSFLTAKKIAEAQGKSQALFFTLFNLAAYQSTNGQVEEALKNYQIALEISPKNKDVRENIEKLWQQQEGQGQGGNSEDEKQNEDDQQNQDGQGGEPPPPKPQDGQGKKKKPKPFKSQELSQDDVRKILEEIQNQEQKIRADVYEGKAKDAPRVKDW